MPNFPAESDFALKSKFTFGTMHHLKERRKNTFLAFYPKYFFINGQKIKPVICMSLKLGHS